MVVYICGLLAMVEKMATHVHVMAMSQACIL